jgi:hypothetical protein
MREGVKQFTDYTNKWKTRTDETKGQFQHALPRAAAEIPDAIPKESYAKVSKRRLATDDAEAAVFTPELPSPPKENNDNRRIAFTRPLDDITLLAKEFLEDEEAKPGQVGEACFDAQLEKHKKAKRKS